MKHTEKNNNRKMFKRLIQPGLLCIFDADHEKPLKLWDKKIRDGQIKRTICEDIKGLVLEMTCKNPMCCYITSPILLKQTLGIWYPYIHLVLKLPCTTFYAFDVQILDDKSIKRRLRASTVQAMVDVQPFMLKLPLTLEHGWNHVSMPLHQIVKDIYGTRYVETLRVALYPNCLLKKVYFSDKLYDDEDLPMEFLIEDTDASENYRLKYTTMVTQKRKHSLSYYPDLISGKNCFKPYTLHSFQNKPLRLWDKRIRAGHIHQLEDHDLQGLALEIVSSKSSRTYITCPANPKEVLGIRAPFLNFIIKNLYKPFVVDVLVQDNKNVTRRFRVLTKQANTQLKPFVCKIPLSLENGWNQIVVPLSEYTLKAFGTKYVKTLRVQMHATCRVFKVYFSQRIHELNEFEE